MCGVHKRNHGKYERSPFTEMEEVQKGDVEMSLNRILNSATITSTHNIQADLVAEPRETDRDNVPRFIMVVWNGYGEFEAMASVFPSIAREISHWVDLSDIVVNMSASASSRRPYSLRDVTLSLGFGAKYSQKLSRGHSAGMDAVRTIGVLLAPVLQVDNRPLRNTSPRRGGTATSKAVGGSTGAVREFPVHDKNYHGRRSDAAELVA